MDTKLKPVETQTPSWEHKFEYETRKMHLGGMGNECGQDSKNHECDCVVATFKRITEECVALAKAEAVVEERNRDRRAYCAECNVFINLDTGVRS